MPWLEDDGRSPEVSAIESAADDLSVHVQAITVRVGPVFHGNNRDDAPGIWISYQKEHMNSLPNGPVLLDEATWRALSKAVDRRLRKWRVQQWRRLLLRMQRS